MSKKSEGRKKWRCNTTLTQMTEEVKQKEGLTDQIRHAFCARSGGEGAIPVFLSGRYTISDTRMMV